MKKEVSINPEGYGSLNTPVNEQQQFTFTDDGSYHSYSRKNDHAFRPWILLHYTLRKNKEQRIKENKLLHNKKEGIKLLQ